MSFLGTPFLAGEQIFGDDEATGVLYSGAVGLGNIVSRGDLSLRLEAEIFSGREHNPAAISSAFSTGQAAAALIQNHGVLMSVWADLRAFEDVPLVLSLGGGVGAVQTEISAATNALDFGSGTVTNFAYMLGGQAAWEFDENWTLALTGRFVDYGTAEVATNSLFASANPGVLLQTAPGRIAVDQTAFQAMLSVRLRFGLGGL